MRPRRAVVTDHILGDRLLRRDKAWVANVRYPLCFQTPEEPLCRSVIPAISSPTEALFHLTTPEQLSESEAGVLTPLIRVKHDSRWLPTGFISNRQRLIHQLRVR